MGAEEFFPSAMEAEEFFGVHPKKVPRRIGTLKSRSTTQAPSTRRKLNSTQSFETSLCPAGELGDDLPVDFFPVDPKKVSFFVRPKKAKKVYRNWSAAEENRPTKPPHPRPLSLEGRGEKDEYVAARCDSVGGGTKKSACHHEVVAVDDFRVGQAAQGLDDFFGAFAGDGAGVVGVVVGEAAGEFVAAAIDE
jgi:hypothetical protein